MSNYVCYSKNEISFSHWSSTKQFSSIFNNLSIKDTFHSTYHAFLYLQSESGGGWESYGARPMINLVYCLRRFREWTHELELIVLPRIGFISPCQGWAIVSLMYLGCPSLIWDVMLSIKPIGSTSTLGSIPSDKWWGASSLWVPCQGQDLSPCCIACDPVLGYLMWYGFLQNIRARACLLVRCLAFQVNLNL